MKRIQLIDVVLILLAILVVLLGGVIALGGNPSDSEPTLEAPTASAPQSTESVPPTTEGSYGSAYGGAHRGTHGAATPDFVLTFVGDCTFGCNARMVNMKSAFPLTVGEDYGYPFRNVLSYFQNDDYSLINLEGVLGDQGSAKSKKYVFRGSGEYTKIMTQNGIEGVNLANNHSGDYGDEGYAETKRLLEEAGIAYVEHLNSTMITTDSGLKIGLFAADSSLNPVDNDQILEGIAQLKADGAELIICAFHWGVENTFRSNARQQELGHAAIDAGANIVWGHHPHVLQPIESYNGGVIYYSLGNFAFGGNSAPKDLDTALLQQEVIRDVDGSIRLGELTIVPCSVSSVGSYNNFQPTPYEPDSKQYERVLSKLDASYKGGSLPIG